MYKSASNVYQQMGFNHFNQSCGLQLNPENEWIKTAHRLPWDAWEPLYAALFQGTNGNVAKPFRMVLGALIIQLRMGLTDRDLVNQTQENPYYQYFIGLEGFQNHSPFGSTLLVEWRKRMNVALITKVNDILCDAIPANSTQSFGAQNNRTLIATQICDATVAPQNIRYPQDTSLLDEARRKLETMIDRICQTNDLEKPRTYRKVAHKNYLSFAKSKRPSEDYVRDTVKKQLQFVQRDLKYIDAFLQQGYALDKRDLDNLVTIRKLYEQQKYMFDNHTHIVENRIVSISQPYVRPVVRGKAHNPTEFGAKLHLSIDERGFARIEHLAFESFNEGPMLISALEAYKYRNGRYPDRVLVDQLYRTRKNIEFCREHNIQLSGPKLGRKPADKEMRKKNAKAESRDMTDRIQIERFFSTAKRRNGMGLIDKKREDTSLSTIAMAVLVTNIFGSFSLALNEAESNS